jgi:serine/threonine protein kinase
VDHLEKIEISHRDIKPDNIFVNTESGAIPRLVLGDWGCATGSLKFKNDNKLTNGDLRRGNGAFMPPEIRNAKKGSWLDYSR